MQNQRMRVEREPAWDEKWEDNAVFGVYLWTAEGGLRTWYRISECDVLQAIEWARSVDPAEAYSLALLVSDPTERSPDQDGRVWLLGGNVLAGEQPHRD